MKIIEPSYLVLCRDAPKPPQSGVSGSATLETEGFASAGRACQAWQRRDCYDEKRGNIGMIEFAGRTCYKSEGVPGRTDSFVRGLVKRGHLSVLEHGDMVFEVLDWRIYEFLSDTLRSLKDSGNNVPQLTMSKICNRCLISGNIRAWLELFSIGSWLGDYFKGHFDCVYLGDVPVDLKPSDKVRPIKYSDLKGYAEKKLHQRATVRFVIDRGISHEFVRHRLFSFSQESTRYCNYAQDRFGGEISCIRPFYLDEGTDGFEIWKAQCESAEKAYFDLLNYGLTAQEARAVLPTCVKTELVMTGTLGQWDHFFDMRAREKGGKVHPQALEVTKPLLEDFETLYPDIFDGSSRATAPSASATSPCASFGCQQGAAQALRSKS